MYGYFYDNNYVYIVYELANSGNLFELLKSEHKFTEREIIRFIIQIMKAMIYLKKRNIIHRDLKLENILINKRKDANGETYEYKVSDFGCACQYFKESKTTMCGTVDYLSPEVCNHQQYDYGVDTWAIGIMIYELLTGYSPFHDKDSKITKEKIKGFSDFKSISEPLVKRGINSNLYNLLHRIFERDVNKRIKFEEIVQLNWIRECATQKENEEINIIINNKCKSIIN